MICVASSEMTVTEERIHDAATVAARNLGYEEKKLQQLQVVTGILRGRDVFAVLSTGYGKSLPCIVDLLLPLPVTSPQAKYKTVGFPELDMVLYTTAESRALGACVIAKRVTLT